MGYLNLGGGHSRYTKRYEEEARRYYGELWVNGAREAKAADPMLFTKLAKIGSRAIILHSMQALNALNAGVIPRKT